MDKAQQQQIQDFDQKSGLNLLDIADKIKHEDFTGLTQIHNLSQPLQEQAVKLLATAVNDGPATGITCQADVRALRPDTDSKILGGMNWAYENILRQPRIEQNYHSMTHITFDCFGQSRDGSAVTSHLTENWDNNTKSRSWGSVDTTFDNKKLTGDQ